MVQQVVKRGIDSVDEYDISLLKHETASVELKFNILLEIDEVIEKEQESNQYLHPLTE